MERGGVALYRGAWSRLDSYQGLGLTEEVESIQGGWGEGAGVISRGLQ